MELLIQATPTQKAGPITQFVATPNSSQTSRWKTTDAEEDDCLWTNWVIGAVPNFASGVYRTGTGSCDPGDRRITAAEAAQVRAGRAAELLSQSALQGPSSTSPSIAPPPPPTESLRPPGNLDFGRYHALIIGNQSYRHFKALATPLEDARALAAMLDQDYGFADVRLVLDATRTDMLNAFDDALRKLGPADNLLIYYAGHGVLDRGSERGYWLPVDAETDRRANWLSNADITDTLKSTRAKHVMVVADSCYSGSLVRSVNIVPTSDADLRRLTRAKARTVMTSGGLEPVADSGGGRHSVFAKAFLDGLRANDGVIDGAKLFAGLRRKVLLNADQTPQYADIRLAGHDGGDFLFVRKRP